MNWFHLYCFSGRIVKGSHYPEGETTRPFAFIFPSLPLLSSFLPLPLPLPSSLLSSFSLFFSPFSSLLLFLSEWKSDKLLFFSPGKFHKDELEGAVWAFRILRPRKKLFYASFFFLSGKREARRPDCRDTHLALCCFFFDLCWGVINCVIVLHGVFCVFWFDRANLKESQPTPKKN